MNKRNHTKSGSAILTVILVMSAIIFCGFNLWKSTVLTTELVLMRQEREQNLRATEGVLNYGINLCINRFSSLLAQAETGGRNWSLDVGQWQINDEVSYLGHLEITLEGEVVQLFASLFSGDCCTFGMECKVERKTEKTDSKSIRFFEIRDWQVHSI